MTIDEASWDELIDNVAKIELDPSHFGFGSITLNLKVRVTSSSGIKCWSFSANIDLFQPDVGYRLCAPGNLYSIPDLVWDVTWTIYHIHIRTLQIVF